MTLHHETIDDKLAAVEKLIPLYRQIGRATNDDGTYRALKAIAAELRARQNFPRNMADEELRHALTRVSQTRVGSEYDIAALIGLAQVLNNRWPLVSQALERFGTEQA